MGADAQRHDQLHVPQRSDRHQRPARSQPHQRARPRREQGGNNYSVQLLARCRAACCSKAAYNQHNGEVSDFSAIREPANTVIYRSDRRPHAADEQLRRLRPGHDRPARHEGRRAASAAVDLGRHPSRAASSGRGTTTSATRRSSTTSHLTSLPPGLSGLTAGELATGSFSSRRLQRQQHERLRRADQHHQRPAEPRAFYSAVRHQRQRHDHAGGAGSRLTFTSTAGNPNGMVNYDRTLQSQRRSAGDARRTA